MRGVLSGPLRRGRLLAAFPSAVYVAADPAVVAVVTADGVRLPNAVVVAGRSFGGIAPDAPATVGAGRLTVGPLEVRVGRWWDPRPRLGVVDPAALASNAARVEGWLRPASGGSALRSRAEAFERACRACDADQAAVAGGRLLGLGDGLTPAGDDLLAGAIAGWHLFGEVAGGVTGERLRALAGRVFGGLDLPAGTTALSASLLRHAAAGEVAGPVAHACEGLTGRAALEPAVSALRDVGHSSGDWLLRGLLVAAGWIPTFADRPRGGEAE